MENPGNLTDLSDAYLMFFCGGKEKNHTEQSGTINRKKIPKHLKTIQFFQQ